MPTFAIPFEKRVSEKRNNKFIEKTDLLYKKQVPRNTIYREALISLSRNYKCQDKLRDIYYTMKSLILAQDER